MMNMKEGEGPRTSSKLGKGMVGGLKSVKSGLSEERIGRSQSVGVLLTQHNWSTKGDEVILGVLEVKHSE